MRVKSALAAIVASARRERACLFHDQKLVNVGIVPSLATRGRAEQVKTFTTGRCNLTARGGAT